MTYDAWDIDIYYQDKMTPVSSLDSIAVLEEGPLRATVEIKRTFGRGSTLTQRVSIYRDLPRIDFATPRRLAGAADASQSRLPRQRPQSARHL